jgi:uncharacterized caspase-like protein
LLCSSLSLLAGTCYLTVSGLGGEPDYEQRFVSLAKTVDKILRESGAQARVETLYGPAATRERVRAALEAFSRDCRPDDALVVMLIGHGTFDGADYKFNLPGPDLSAIDLAGLLDRVPTSRQLVVNMTSASGGALDTLGKENRVVITATKSGTEKNATVFARYWVEALRDAAADADKNESVSALEAFRYADSKTVEFYDSQKRLATEHAMLDDTGARQGVRAPSTENGQGKLAGSFMLVRFGSAQAAANSPEKRELLAKREELERQIDLLKYRKAAMPSDDYRKQLGALLLDLARTQEEIDR